MSIKSFEYLLPNASSFAEFSQLASEILFVLNVADFPYVVSVNHNKAVITVLLSRYITEQEKAELTTELDKFLLNFDDHFLACYKRTRVEQIDATTGKVIDEGFEYDGDLFSLSTNAQLSWNSLLTAHGAGLLVYPMSVTTLDDTEMVLADAEALLLFISEAYKKVTITKAVGLNLKVQINEATSAAQLDSIIDPRV